MRESNSLTASGQHGTMKTSGEVENRIKEIREEVQRDRKLLSRFLLVDGGIPREADRQTYQLKKKE